MEQINKTIDAAITAKKKWDALSRIVEKAADLYRTEEGKEQDQEARKASSEDSAQPV